jgi:hypothetical protein
LKGKYIMLYHKRRIERKIHLRMLFPKNEIKAAKEFSKLKYVRARILPEIFSSPIAINIYGDKVAFLMESGKASPTSILIEDENLSNAFRKYFYTLWTISKMA